MNASFAVDIKERTENLKLAEKKIKKRGPYFIIVLLSYINLFG
jgi:hypothetical protein